MRGRPTSRIRPLLLSSTPRNQRRQATAGRGDRQHAHPGIPGFGLCHPRAYESPTNGAFISTEQEFRESMGFRKAKGFRRSGRVEMGLSASGHWVHFCDLDSGLVQYAGGRGLPVWRGPSSRDGSIHKRRRISELFSSIGNGFKDGGTPRMAVDEDPGQ